MADTHRSNKPLLLHHLKIDCVKRFQVIQEDHVELQRAGHVERLSKRFQAGCRAANNDLSISTTPSRYSERTHLEHLVQSRQVERALSRRGIDVALLQRDVSGTVFIRVRSPVARVYTVGVDVEQVLLVSIELARRGTGYMVRVAGQCVNGSPRLTLENEMPEYPTYAPSSKINCASGWLSL